MKEISSGIDKGIRRQESGGDATSQAKCWRQGSTYFIHHFLAHSIKSTLVRVCSAFCRADSRVPLWLYYGLMSVVFGTAILVAFPLMDTLSQIFASLLHLGCLLIQWSLMWSDPGEISGTLPLSASSIVKADKTDKPALVSSNRVVSSERVYWVDDMLKRFPADPTYFPAGRVCRTCRFEKPARSRHCGICGFCVAKYDHHCVWLRNCIGLGNYSLFISFLICHWLLTGFGAVRLYFLLQELVRKWQLWDAVFVDAAGERHDPSLLIVIQYMVGKKPLLCGLWTLCVAMAGGLTFFLTLEVFVRYGLGYTLNEVYRGPARTITATSAGTAAGTAVQSGLAKLRQRPRKRAASESGPESVSGQIGLPWRKGRLYDLLEDFVW